MISLTAGTKSHKGTAGKPPGSSMTLRDSNSHLAFYTLPRPEAASD